MNFRRFLSSFSLAVSVGVVAFAQMTDQAVLNYIKQGMSQGKTQAQIGNELLAKGVTVSQAKRLMAAYKANSTSDFTSLETTALNPERTASRNRTNSKRSQKNPYGRDSISTDSEASDKSKEKNLSALRDAEGNVIRKKEIFGHNVFTAKNLSFEPNENRATPESYVLGPGDEILIDVWGVNEASFSETISPEGRIIISQVGPIQLSGLTIKEATSRIKSALSHKYSLSGENAASRMSVTLGNIRTIQVNVLGEVRLPGTYRLSSLSTVFNALYRAGGVTEIGSLRNIRIFRGGEQIGSADIYKFIFDGNSDSDLSLNDGDVIMVPAYQAVVQAGEGLKRPMMYEILPGESAGSIIGYAGGFVSNAHRDEISVQRRDGAKGRVFNVHSDQFASFGLQDGDIVSAHSNTQENLFDNKVEIRGCVLRPGLYALGSEIATVRQLVEHSGGLLDDAFRARAQIVREKKDRSLEVLAIPVGAIMDGTEPDVMLRDNDLLMIANVNEIDPKGNLTITGYVLNPGNYEFADNMTVEDLIMLAGGLEPGASNSRVDVSRRIVDPSSTEAGDTLATIFSFTLHDGLVVEGNPDFVLQPFDIVSIRKSPTYVEQKRVRVSGEVTFPGEYTLVTNQERLSDLVKRAGGAAPNGFLQGAMLKRKVNEDERNVRRNMVNLVKKGGEKMDSTKLEKLTISEIYTVGINLDKALANPGSEYDVILHDNDELIIPAITNTVRVQGEVLYPNAVNYLPGKNLRYYINQSGGFSNLARRAKVYVVYMNGKVAIGMGAKILPGSEIVVPARLEKEKMKVGEWMGIGTAAASIATATATIATLIKR